MCLSFNDTITAPVRHHSMSVEGDIRRISSVFEWPNTAPNKPIWNEFVESFSSRPRDARLNEHLVVSDRHAREGVEG